MRPSTHAAEHMLLLPPREDTPSLHSLRSCRFQHPRLPTSAHANSCAQVFMVALARTKRGTRDAWFRWKMFAVKKAVAASKWENDCVGEMQQVEAGAKHVGRVVSRMLKGATARAWAKWAMAAWEERQRAKALSLVVARMMRGKLGGGFLWWVRWAREEGLRAMRVATGLRAVVGVVRRLGRKNVSVAFLGWRRWAREEGLKEREMGRSLAVAGVGFNLILGVWNSVVRRKEAWAFGTWRKQTEDVRELARLVFKGVAKGARAKLEWGWRCWRRVLWLEKREMAEGGERLVLRERACWKLGVALRGMADKEVRRSWACWVGEVDRRRGGGEGIRRIVLRKMRGELGNAFNVWWRVLEAEKERQRADEWGEEMMEERWRAVLRTMRLGQKRERREDGGRRMVMVWAGRERRKIAVMFERWRGYNK